MKTVTDLLPENSWFREYMACYEDTEPPRSYLLFSAMATLGAVLGRRIWMQYDVHEIRPILNLLIIGPSGIGKSTSVKISRNLLKGIANEPFCPQFVEGSTTKEKLHHNLVPNPHAIIFAPELAAFFSKENYKEGLLPYVTQLLDYEDNIKINTRKDDSMVVEFPEVAVIGASTKEWLHGMLPDSAVTGGFLARFLLLNESVKYKSVPNPQFHRSEEQERALQAKRAIMTLKFETLVRDAFNAAGSALNPNPITYEEGYDAVDAYDRWYRNYRPTTGILSPFAARAGEMVLRLAILMAISCGRFCITEEDIRSAINVYNYQAKGLEHIVVGTSPQGKLIASVLEAISYTGTDVIEIYQKLQPMAASYDVHRVITSLIKSKSINYDPEEKLYYRRHEDAEDS